MKRDVWLLFGAQALMNAVTAGQVVMSALIGHSLAADKALATLPYALQMAATMAASIPAGLVFAHLGRKPGFLLGAAASFVGSLIFAAGVWRGDFGLYCLGAIPAGLGFGISQHLRFAAAEAAAPAARARAISLVMAGGVIAAILGPELVKRSKDLVPPLLFLGTYLCIALLPLAAAILVAFTRLQKPVRHAGRPTPIAQILARPDFIVAVIAGLAAYGSMNLIMASTPVQMMLCGFGVNDSADVIRAHSIAMFAPGFFTGRLIQRFGAHRVIGAGGILIGVCAALSLAGPGYLDFTTALTLLGLGWNLMFTGATALLTLAYDATERVRAQATNDFIVFGTVACTSFGSGALHATAGWVALNFAVVPPVAIAVALVLWRRASLARVAAA
jgi:MFS family permease